MIRLLIFCFCLGAHAAKRDGVEMPDSIELGGKKLVLNGLGTREATIFSVDVYVAGLYLPSKSGDAQAILRSGGVKKLQMKFVRDVDADSIRDAWKESIAKNCHQHCGQFRAARLRMGTLVSDIKAGDTMAYTFYPNRVEISVRGRKQGSITGAEFARLVLAAFIGKPPNAGLKEGLLGQR